MIDKKAKVDSKARKLIQREYVVWVRHRNNSARNIPLRFESHPLRYEVGSRIQ